MMVRNVFFKTFLFSLLVLVSVSTSYASSTSSNEAGKGILADRGTDEKKSAVNEFIMHHLKDAHDFHLFSNAETGAHYGFPLPVILCAEQGLVAFMSSEFHHDDAGKVVVEHSDGKFVKYHGKIYELNSGESVLKMDNAEHPHPLNAKKIMFDLSITKNVFSIFLIGLIMLLLFTKLAKSYKKNPIPTGFGRVLEPLVLYVRDDIARPNIGEKQYRKFMPYLLTVFFFIWMLNLLGMTPLGVNVTGNIAVTLCLALFTYFITQFSGNKNYWGHIFWMPGVHWIMKLFLIPIELLGTITKPFALMLRLFANITAGHVIIMTLIGLIFTFESLAGGLGLSVIFTLFISVIELLVAFLQAYIFTMLSSLFIGMAVEEHGH
ncbi:MAG: F0F1 ATP synthase subunit A [Flavobacteriales bacterium]